MAKKKAGRQASDPDSLGETRPVDPGPPVDPKPPVDPEPPVEFETAVEEIEQIVRGLEGGEWSLATSLREYERAIGRLQTCHVLLQDAERHVSLLSGFDAEGNPVTESIAGDPGEGLEAKRRSRSRHRGVKSDGGVRSEGRAGIDLDVDETSDPSAPPELF